MDVLSQLLDVAHARAAAFCQSAFEAPWGLRIADQAPLALVTPLAGQAWVCLDDHEPVLLDTGDVAVIKDPEPYTVSDDPATTPTLIVGPGNRVTALDGADIAAGFTASSHTTALHRTMPSPDHDRPDPERAECDRPDDGRPGLRRAGGGATVLGSGTYALAGDVNARLLSVLPRIVTLPRAEVNGPVMRLLAAEVRQDRPGQQVVLDRLLDLALVTCLGAWFAGAGAHHPGWHRAHSNPVVAATIRAIHDDPAQPWTVASLAERAHVSRAGLARRFTTVIGQSPIAYLTCHRIDLAADLLRDTDATVEDRRDPCRLRQRLRALGRLQTPPPPHPTRPHHTLSRPSTPMPGLSGSSVFGFGLIERIRLCRTRPSRM